MGRRLLERLEEGVGGVEVETVCVEDDACLGCAGTEASKKEWGAELLEGLDKDTP